MIAVVMVTTTFVVAPFAEGGAKVFAATSGAYTYSIVANQADATAANVAFYGVGAYITKYGGGKSATVPASLGGQPVVYIDLEFTKLKSLNIAACSEKEEKEEGYSYTVKKIRDNWYSIATKGFYWGI